MIPFESCDLHMKNEKVFCSIKHVVSYEQNPVHEIKCILQFLIDRKSVPLHDFHSPESWQTWFHSRKICIDVIWQNFCYLADDEAPILNCPNISSTTDEGLNSSSTVLLSSTATDNVDFDLDVNCSHSSEDIFLIGDTTVNCSSSDAAGNTETCLYS